jgi:hypothetical protein
MRVTNIGPETVAFRDDAGKHHLEPGASLEVTGDQHLPHVLSLPGIVPASEVPARRPRPPVKADDD